MEKEFLRQVAELFVSREGDNLVDYCFVFPNRRSSLFFQKYLGESSSKPIFSPKLVTINSLFLELSGLKSVDNISAMLLLYQIYSDHFLKNPANSQIAIETLDEFFFWGDVILNDFDDVDKYLVDAQKLFSNIKDLKELESDYDFLTDEQYKAISSFWGNLNISRGSKKEEAFIKLWSMLFPIYQDFKKSLKERGEGYEGMIYREVAENLNSVNSLPEPLKKYKQIVFVGLNALNKCEKSLLSLLKREGVADFYWDYYGKIIRDPKNKSSLFMDQNIKDYPSLYPLFEDTNNERELPHIEVIGIPSTTGQAKYVYEIIDKLIPDDENVKLNSFHTSIVLPDEKLLQPLLSSIPEKFHSVNVTMGYSLKNTNAASFIDILSSLHKRVKLKDSKISFYHLDVLDILYHPYISLIAPDDSKIIADSIINENLIYVSPERLKGNSLFSLIFNPTSYMILDKVERIQYMANYQQEVLVRLAQNLSGMEKEFVYHYYTCINRIKNLSLPISIDTYFKLQQQIVSSISIPYKGEPLSGLQIMGPLETRSLDFDNIIILSVNEGVFPSKSISTSFIPYNLRKGYDLPNYEFQDSISAYHFYRSIYRAKNVFLLYDCRAEALNSGEVSRFVKQLKYHHIVPMRESSLSYNVPIAPKNDIVIEKSEKMFDIFFCAPPERKIFSASLLNTYLDCPLQFYFKSIEGLKEADEVTEEVESGLFGSLFHKAAENIYSEFVGKEVTKEELEAIIKDEPKIEKHIRDAFKEEMKISEISGKNKIIEALIKRYIIQVLTFDVTVAPFSYIESEKRCKFDLKVCGGEKMVTLYGFIDRIDIKEGRLRVIDYKSGTIHVSQNDMAEMFDTESKNRPFTTFQLYMYMLFLKKMNFWESADNMELDVYSLKKIFENNIYSQLGSDEDLIHFEEYLVKLIDSIFDLSVPFTQTSNPKHCEYCPFKVICNR